MKTAIFSAMMALGCMSVRPAPIQAVSFQPAAIIYNLDTDYDSIEGLLQSSDEEFQNAIRTSSLEEIQALMASCTWQQSYYLCHRLLSECPDVLQAVGQNYIEFSAQWQQNFTEQFMHLPEDEQHAMAMEGLTGKYSGNGTGNEWTAPAPEQTAAKQNTVQKSAQQTSSSVPNIMFLQQWFRYAACGIFILCAGAAVFRTYLMFNSSEQEVPHLYRWGMNCVKKESRNDKE